MKRLKPDKLSVEFTTGTTPIEPITPRRYTLTHSDITAELFLTIGLNYAFDKITKQRDEVLGEWIKKDAGYIYHVYLYVDGEFSPGIAAIRDSVFRRELPLALEAIKYGDKSFFNAYPLLNNSPIIVFFRSSDIKFNKIENWGTFADYELNRFCNYYEEIHVRR